MYNSSTSNPVLKNCTISGNLADFNGGGMNNNENSHIVIHNSIFWNNKGNGRSNSGNQIWSDLTSNISMYYSAYSAEQISDIRPISRFSADVHSIEEDPLFLEPVSPDNAPTNAGDYRVRANSPVIDIGNNGILPYFVVTDLYGRSRYLDGIGDGFVSVDMGAFEFYPSDRILETSLTDENQVPKSFTLRQNYPNPFNPTTQIEFSVPNTSNVTLDVFNIQGQRVATLVDGYREPGVHSVKVDAAHLSSGVYLYRIQAGNFTQVNKMMVIK